MSNNKHHKWLTRELPQWVQQQLITAEQANNISLYYQQRYANNMGRSVFSAIGAVLFGLGIILFFAYNWQDMHRSLKLLIIFSIMISANMAAIWFAAPPRNNNAASEGLALLGTLLFGAAIWLISQIYHIDEHYPNAFILWGSGALAMGWARMSPLQCLAAIILLFSWGCLEIFSFQQWYHSSPWLLLFGTASLAWVLRSAWLLFFAIIAFYFLWIASIFEPLDDAVGYIIFAFAVFLIQLGFITERIKSLSTWNFRQALVIPGFLVYLTLVYMLTFKITSTEIHYIYPFKNTLQNSFFWVAFIVSLLMPLLSLAPRSSWNPLKTTDFHHSLLMLITVALIYLTGINWIEFSPTTISYVMNLIFIGHCFLFILHGSKEQQGQEVTAGCLLFSALVFARYTDLFDSLLSRSVMFLMLGAGLFLVGNFYARHKKEPSSSMSLEGAN